MTGAASTRESSDARPEPLDLRLAAPAVAAWLAAMVVLRLPPMAGLGVAAVAATGGTALAWRRPGAWWTVAVAALACAAAAATCAALRVAAAGQGPLRDLAEERAVATLELVVVSDPRRVSTAGATPAGPGGRRQLAIVEVRVERVEARGQRVDVRTPAVVLASDLRWLELEPSMRVRAAGRLLPARPGDDAAAAFSARGPPQRLGGPSAVQRVAGRLRAGLRDSVSGLSPEVRGLVPGLVVGDTSQLPESLEEDFRTTGLTHLTAVSGANVAIVMGFVLLLARWAGVGGRMSPVLAALAVAGFVVLARPEPSVLRAAVMGLVAVAALATGRRRRGMAALATAVLLLVLVDPWLARSYGFALSVLATSGLLLLAPVWRDALARRLPRPLAEAVAVPAAAQVCCAPVVAMLSAQVSLVAVPANLLAAAAVAPATVLGVLAAATSAVSDPVAAVFGRLAGVPGWWIVVVARHGADVPMAALDWPDGASGALLLAALTAVAVLGTPWLLRRRGAPALLVTCAVAAMLPPLAFPGWPPEGWVLVACSVGQGDALVLSAGPGTGVVVDAGPDPGEVDDCLRDLGVSRVPLVLLTHLHADHVEGLPGVLRGRAVGEVVVGPLDEPAEQARRVAMWTARAGVPVTRAAVGEQRAVGDLRWEVLWPARVIPGGDGSVENNASVVVLAERAGVRMLLTGDIEPEAQQALLRSSADLRADVLKVAHHGSRYQEPVLLSAVAPRVAVVSVGADNTYGHPAPQTLTALSRGGAQLLRTDRDGDVAVVGPAADLRVVGHRDGDAAAAGGTLREDPTAARTVSAAWHARPRWRTQRMRRARCR